MVVARASGTDLASSLKQNTFLTLELCPARVCRCTPWTWYLSWGGVPPQKGSPLPLSTHRTKMANWYPSWGGDPNLVPNRGLFHGVPHPRKVPTVKG